jgi:hypothetical protein
MACEVLAELTLNPCSRPGRRGRGTSASQARNPLKLYKQRTHDKIDAQTFWPTYKAHAERRHKVVHQGERVNESHARESFNAAGSSYCTLKVSGEG